MKNLFLSFFLFICLASQAQIITTVAGPYVWPNYGYSGDGGPSVNAQIRNPKDIAVDASGNVYFCDEYNYCIRKITVSTGIISTVAGNGTPGFSGDGGLAINAILNRPTQIAFDGAFNIYFVDAGNNRIRKINASTGIITTVVGNGTTNCYPNCQNNINGVSATSVSYVETGFAVDAAGFIYTHAYYYGYLIKVNPNTNIIATIAGNGYQSYTGNGISALSPNTSIFYIQKIALDASGNIYIIDQPWNIWNCIRKINISTGIISTIAGANTTNIGNTDGLQATSAYFYHLGQMRFDNAGNLIFTDPGNLRIRKINMSTGVLSTLAGSGNWSSGEGNYFSYQSVNSTGDNGLATSATLTPDGLAIDASGNMYISTYDNHIRKVSPANSPIQLNLKAYLQGLYLGNGKMIASPNSANGTTPASIADTLTVELRNTTGAFSVAYSTKTTIDTAGNANISFPSAALGNSYYVVVNHRNSIATWSASPVTMSATTSYSFTTAANKAAGSNLQNDGTGKYLLFSGDINQDGSVDFNDYPDLDIASNNGDLGYFATDLNGDASVDFNDYPILDENSNNGIVTITP